MRGAYRLVVVCLLVSCVYGQLGFPTIPARPGTTPFDSTPPCNGREPQYTLVNDTNGDIAIQVLGNRGANTITVNVADDTIAKDFRFVSKLTVIDGFLGTITVPFNVTQGERKTYQFLFKTGDDTFVYCVDLQHGEYIDENSAGMALTYSSSLLLLISAVFGYIL